MAFKSIRSIFIISLITILCSVIMPTGKVHALTTDSDRINLPALDVFADGIKNGQADELRGLYIPDLLAARVVQQPAGMDGFVSPWQNIVTQFNLASRFRSIGLLAHNDLAGENFSLLHEGQKFYLIYGSGQVSTFVVLEILQYRALAPTSTLSSFVDLKNNDILTTSELFAKVYDRPGQAVLQTCIDVQGNPAWGRLFVIAEPVE